MDLFSEQFKIKIDKKSDKRDTGCGKILSTIVIIISLAYLGYLINQYFSDEFLPKITVMTEQLQSNSQTFNPGDLRFGITYTPQKLLAHLGSQEAINQAFGPDKPPLLGGAFQMDIEKGEIKKFNMTGCPESEISKPDPIAPVQTCLETSTQVDIDSTGKENPVFFMVGKCHMFLPDAACPDRAIVDLLLSEADFFYYFDIITETFDAQREKRVKSLQRKSLPSDLDNIEQLQVFLEQTTTKYDKGFFVQNTQEITQISDYRMEQTTMSSRSAFVKFEQMFSIPQQGDLLLSMKVNYGLTKRYINVEFIKLSELIAMFLGIFNTLVSVGYLGKLVSEAVITEELMEGQLKTEYKRTAYEIDQANQKSEWNQKYNKEGYLIRNKVSLTALLNQLRDRKVSKDKEKIATELTVKEREENAEEQLKLKKLIIYNTLNQKIADSMSIEYIQSTLQQMNTLLAMMITEDQYAAMMYCGKRIPELIQPSDKTINHLEIIEQIENDEEMQKKIIKERFLPRIEGMQEKNENLPLLDKNIYECMIKNFSNKEKEINDTPLEEVKKQSQQKVDTPLSSKNLKEFVENSNNNSNLEKTNSNKSFRKIQIQDSNPEQQQLQLQDPEDKIQQDNDNEQLQQQLQQQQSKRTKEEE